MPRTEVASVRLEDEYVEDSSDEEVWLGPWPPRSQGGLHCLGRGGSGHSEA